MVTAAEPETLREKAPKVLLVAGEASGDFQGSLLGAEMKKLCPALSLWGVGGALMSQAGFKLLFDTTHWGAMGFSQAVGKVPLGLWALRQLVTFAKKERPNVVVLIDAPAFNLRLGRRLKLLGFPILYYFPPRSWVKENGSAEALSQACHKVVTPFPWSAEMLRQQGLEAYFFGHPLLDVYPRPAFPNPKPSNNPTIGLFPGSRRHEVKYILPHMLAGALEIAKRVPGAGFFVSLAPSIKAVKISKIISHQRWSNLDLQLAGPAQEVLPNCHLAIVTSGSITLEAALCHVPMVTVYRGSLGMWLQYKLFLRHLKHIAMPNILAEERIVPELYQKEASGQAIAGEALKIVEDQAHYETIQARLAEVTAQLQPPGATKKTAELVLDMLSGLEGEDHA